MVQTNLKAKSQNLCNSRERERESLYLKSIKIAGKKIQKLNLIKEKAELNRLYLCFKKNDRICKF